MIGAIESSRRRLQNKHVPGLKNSPVVAEQNVRFDSRLESVSSSPFRGRVDRGTVAVYARG